jgi:DedD protein
MDRQLLERMVGAAVLIVALVVIAPAVLDGPGEPWPELTRSDVRDDEMRTVTIRPDRSSPEPPVARPSLPQSDLESAQTGKVSSANKRPEAPPDPSPPPVEPVKARAPPAQPEPHAPRTKPAPAAVETAQRSGWAVQLGSFARRVNAQRLAGEVSAKGYEAYLLPMEKDGRTLYRVRVGPRSSREAAEQLAGELAKAGYKGQVAREGQAT